MLKIVLAGKPMGKERVRFVKATGRTFTPERTVNYEGRLALAAQQAMGDRPLFEGPLSVSVEVFIPIAESWPKKRKEAALSGRERPTVKPDLDNFAKTLDALNLVVWTDDSQIVEMAVAKHYSSQPRMEIEVRRIGEDVFG